MSSFGSAVLTLLLGLFVGILVCLEVGYRIGSNGGRKNHELAYEGTGTIEAALFSLLGLLLAFSFAGATSRLESRYQLVVREANAIETAYHRLDLLPATYQPGIRHLFRDYLNARVQAHEKLSKQEAAGEEFARASELQEQIWAQAFIASEADQTHNSARLLLPALNEMSDVTTSRSIALEIHLPALIFYLLICIALLTGLLAGYSMSKRQSDQLDKS